MSRRSVSRRNVSGRTLIAPAVIVALLAVGLVSSAALTTSKPSVVQQQRQQHHQLQQQQQQQYACKAEDHLGAGCPTDACSGAPGTYAGLYCTCQQCPSTVGTSEFEKKLHFCLVLHFRVCPPGTHPEARGEPPVVPENDTLSHTKTVAGATAAGQTSDDEAAASPPSSNTTIGAVANSTAAATAAGDNATSTQPADQSTVNWKAWIGLMIGLGILLVGVPALVIWWFRGAGRNKPADDEKNRKEEEPLNGDDKIDGGRQQRVISQPNNPIT